MFSSKELISFVFANENDTYYGDDLLKRDLNQYLWDRLHANYEAVYFLNAEGSSFSVRSYGDLCCSEYTPAFGLFGGSAQRRLGGWMQRQLRAKPGETAAFVCSLEDFCTVLSDNRWDSVLEEISGEKKRTGIFVLTASATAERTSKLLLESSVFDKLQETAVTDLRGGAERELYGALKKRKWDNCVFLNTFNWERVRALLMHLVMEYPERCESCGQLDEMTEYLYALLKDPELAEREGLFRGELPMGYLMYTNIYEQLSNERTWKKLESQSRCFALRDRTSKHPENTGVCVLRDRNSYAGRCMKIKLPPWVSREDDAGEYAARLLRDIRCSVSAPKNRLENSEIAAAAENLLNQLDAVHNGDLDTYTQVLSALQFCVSHIYAEPRQEQTSRIMEVIQKQEDAITIFSQYYVLHRDLTSVQAQMSDGALQNATLRQLKIKLFSLEQLKKKYTDLISAMELGLKMPVSADNIQDMLQELEQEVEHFGNLEQAEEEDSPASIPEPEPEIEFHLTDAVYDFIPPSY